MSVKEVHLWLCSENNLLGSENRVALEFSKDLREEGRVRIDPKHFLTVLLNNSQRSHPKSVAILLACEEGFERIADLVAHVGVREVQASEHERLQLAL